MLSEFIISIDNMTPGGEQDKTINEVLRIIMKEIGQFKVYSDHDIDVYKKELQSQITIGKGEVKQRLSIFIDNKTQTIVASDVFQALDLMELDITNAHKECLLIDLLRKNYFKRRIHADTMVEHLQPPALGKKKTRFDESANVSEKANGLNPAPTLQS